MVITCPRCGMELEARDGVLFETAPGRFKHGDRRCADVLESKPAFPGPAWGETIEQLEKTETREGRIRFEGAGP